MQLRFENTEKFSHFFPSLKRLSVNNINFIIEIFWVFNAIFV